MAKKQGKVQINVPEGFTLPEFLYVVLGDVGEYSDHSEWLVAVYADEEAANLHASVANEMWQEAKEKADSEEGNGWDYEAREKFASTFSLDAHMETDYGDTRYRVVKVPFCLHPDHYIDRCEQENLKEKQ